MVGKISGDDDDSVVDDDADDDDSHVTLSLKVGLASIWECLFQALQPNLVNNQYDNVWSIWEWSLSWSVMMMMVMMMIMMMMMMIYDDDDLSVRRLSSARKAKLEIVLSLARRSYLYCIEDRF